MTDYHDDPAFLRLCDLVASDRLVCVTGAGISADLRRDDGKKVPTWWKLLDQLRRDLAGPLKASKHRVAIKELLAQKNGSGRELILAASLLRDLDPKTFDQRFRALVRPKAGTTTPSHKQITRLRPRGILTFNYDPAHEVADRNGRGRTAPKRAVLVPEDEDRLRDHLAGNLATPFLLKAHGDLRASRKTPLTLTADDYRELMVRRPSYRAFVQHLLTEFHLLVVGFGLSDPDFDVFANTIVDAYGRPVRDGVAIFRRGSVPMTRAELRMRLGLQVLEVDEFAEIPTLLAAARSTAGPKLEATIGRCLDDSMRTRSEAHGELRALGPSGRDLACTVLMGRLDTEPDPYRRSELAYSLGYLADLMDRGRERATREIIKRRLCRLVDEDAEVDPRARAMTVLRGLLEQDDQPLVDRWAARFDTRDGSPADRLVIYASYLQAFLPAKFATERAPTAD